MAITYNLLVGEIGVLDVSGKDVVGDPVHINAVFSVDHSAICSIEKIAGDRCRLTGVAAGTATVTAVVINGVLSDTCVVTVKAIGGDGDAATMKLEAHR